MSMLYCLFVDALLSFITCMLSIHQLHIWKCEAPRAGTKLLRKYENTWLISTWHFEHARKLYIDFTLANAAARELNTAELKHFTVAILKFIRKSKLRQ